MRVTSKELRGWRAGEGREERGGKGRGGKG